MSAHPVAAFYPNVLARFDHLEQAIRRAPTIHVKGAWVRDMPADTLGTARGGSFAPDPLWSDGYRVRHNRYVRRGAFPAYHVSDGVTTAAAEVFGVTPTRAPVLGVPGQSRAQLVVAVDVPQVLDLTAAAPRRRLRVSRAEITMIPNWPVTDRWGRPLEYELPQCIGELAFLAGLGGVKYPAARATAGANLVVFTANLARVSGTLHTTNPFTGKPHQLP